MKILINFASRSRPEKFFSALDNLFAMGTTSKFAVLCSLDVDDETMNNPDTRRKISSYVNAHFGRVLIVWGSSKNKVHAINRDIKLVTHGRPWDILLNHSDDMVFTRKGFDQVIIDAMQQYFPDTDGCLHFPDGTVNEKLITYAIMGRNYYDRFGYVYHPDYSSMFCDNEQMDVAKKLGKYQYINQHILEHQHPIWGKAPMDDQYRHTESFYKQDMRVWERRKAAGYPITSV